MPFLSPFEIAMQQVDMASLNFKIEEGRLVRLRVDPHPLYRRWPGELERSIPGPGLYSEIHFLS